MAKDLILEIGTEELPAGFIPGALSSLEGLFKKVLANKRLSFKGLRTMGTPRRLTVIVGALEEEQSDTSTEVKGPAKRAAFDQNGEPTKALSGFARSQGIKVEELKLRKTEKGEYLYAIKKLKGERTKKILPETMEAILSSLYFPKSMRWSDHEMTFARPVHWILALYGGETVRFDFGHVKSGPYTFGHRFLKARGRAAKAIKVKGVKEYFEKLEGSNVMVDPGERKRAISEGLEKEAQGVNGKVLIDEALLGEVTNLVEYPVVIRGSFEREFLELPREVVINAMREHQRYFSVVGMEGGMDGALLPYFITVANTPATDPEVVRRGNERVLKARLNDAKFYFEKDRETTLSRRVEELKGVVFQAKLGTSFEKVLRFTELALFIGNKLEYSDPIDTSESFEDFLLDKYDPSRYEKAETDPLHYRKLVLGRASMLSKSDLTSGMVGEFPNLQGIMGREYARLAGEAPEVSEAIYEHYQPVSAGGRLPESVPGAIISIADKLDTIVGCFGVGLVPTGAHDPYALRRQALGIIAIIVEKGFVCPLDELVDKSLGLIEEKLKRPEKEVEQGVLAFFRERLKNQLLTQGLPHDAIEAVLSAPWFDLVDSVKRVKALEGFKRHPACPSLVVAFKRISNILKGFDFKDERPKEELFEDPHEKALFEVSEKLAPEISAHWQRGDYEKVFTTLASAKETIDTFFDKVMVMVEEERLKRNRLILLHTLRGLYYQIADLSKLVV
jgi:glycyl-tRNA synthetase beta chain